MIEELNITSLSGRGSIALKSGDYQGYWLGQVDWGQAQGQHQTYNYYNQLGQSLVSTNMLSRPLSITGWVIEDANGSMQSRCNVLNGFFSPMEDYVLAYKGRQIQFRPDCSLAYGREFKTNNRKLRRFMLQATCPYPLFRDQKYTAVAFDFSGKQFRFPTDFGQNAPMVFATTERAYRTEVNNTGGFQTGLLAVLKFSGEVKNPRVKNLTTGKLIGANRTFRRLERLELSTALGSKSMVLYTADGAKENMIKYRDYQTSWIQLEPGVNLLALDCDDLEQRNNMTATLYFTPLYLEVE